MGFGPTTSTLARLRSTPELYPHHFANDIFNSTQILKCKHFFTKKVFFLFLCYKMAQIKHIPRHLYNGSIGVKYLKL